MDQVILWKEWTEAFSYLRGAFSRQLTFFWAITYCAGMSLRSNIRGVSSIVCALGLLEGCYKCLDRLAHSSGVDLDKLCHLWVKLCLRLFEPICVDGYVVLVADGIKVPKEGKKMPGVKLMHQQSQSNAKAEFIMGHFIQAVSLLVHTPLGNIAAIPLVARIHDGLVYSNRCTQTVISRLAALLERLSDSAQYPVMVIADAYYASSSLIKPLCQAGGELLCRVKHNAVAYVPVEPPIKKKRGRPKIIGKKVVLRSFFNDFDKISTQTGEYRYYCVNLYWKPAKRVVRLILVEHPQKGRAVFMSTKTDLDPLVAIRLYEKRWLIETGFKTAVHQIGTFAYHFWMKAMKPTKRGQTKQYLHKESKEYRDSVNRKMHAFHVHMMLGCINQGLMQHLAINFRDQVWTSFCGWLRTMRKNVEPSELVVANALRATFPNFLTAAKIGSAWQLFVRERIDTARAGPLSRAA